MVKFFIPDNAPRRSEDIYSWIVKYVEAMTDFGIEPVRIYSLTYRREGLQLRATVGEQEPRTGQLVIAILKSDSYLICTPYYGVRRGEPMQVSSSDASEVQYFEAEGLDRTLEKFEKAVRALDSGGDSLQSRIQLAATTLDAVFLDDLPPIVGAEFLSLKHKLAWKGAPKDTIHSMSDAEAEAAAAAIKALYVDVLGLSFQPEPYL